MFSLFDFDPILPSFLVSLEGEEGKGVPSISSSSLTHKLEKCNRVNDATKAKKLVSEEQRNAKSNVSNSPPA